MKFINFFLSFVGHLLSWIRIRIANPGSDKDPDTDPGTLVNPDPGPQHCNKVPKSESKTKKSSSFRKDRGCTASDIGSNLCVSGRWPCQRRRGVGGGEGRSPSRAATRSRSRRWWTWFLSKDSIRQEARVTQSNFPHIPIRKFSMEQLRSHIWLTN